MEITGRLTADAQVRKTKDNRELVAFTIALNNRYKTKAGEVKDDATFISCSYWVSTKIATILKKGSIATVGGCIGLNAYKTNDGEYHAQLTFHCDHIKLIGAAKNTIPASVTAGSDNQQKPDDDLPF
ncbi:single-stranded DNA-binding protein [Flavipsychrobacter stenotrophus]|uniref:Single-stranded DNA-binding protein n=1 Tax=Flavipsychrobacter stenotrophus TaxID=2077091 RepID=A0A2S7T2L8_9BACT|nr:single-stranded DNA-binding protein [Flavipsychrobacter stenotrophus]PQJ13006.1 single-stranded DNA-binding protein [Flavipsychrobacter stenotrophus]